MGAAKTETGHAGGFILSEAEGTRSRDNLSSLAGGTELKAGQVISKFSSGSDSGDYTGFNQDGSDGSQTPVGISINDVDSSTSEQTIAAITRDAEVNGDELVWPGDITDNEKATAVTVLKGLGIIVRVFLYAICGFILLNGDVTGVSANSVAMAGALVGLGMLDVFKGNAFSVLSLTDAINDIPFIPGRAGIIIPWGESGVTTTSIAIEQKAGVLSILSPSPRGGPGEAIEKIKRTLRTLTIPHFQRDDAVYADEVQGIRAFGSETQLETVQGKVNDRMATHTQDFDATLEYQRIGAVKGVITYADASVVNLFTEFEVSQEAEVDFDLDNLDDGALREICQQTIRTMANNLGNIGMVGVHAFCGDSFFDKLLKNPEVRASYLQTPMASVLRDGYVYANGQKVFGAFEFGGIVWENYRGSINGTPFIPTDKTHLFPMGVPGLFKTVFAPADYIETVNTTGLPRYAKQIEMRNGKGIELEMQSNPLSYCTRPKVLMKGKE